MKVLCWNTNDSVWQHWKNVTPPNYGLVRSTSLEKTIELLEREPFAYCFVYLDDLEFSKRVEEVVFLRQQYPDIKLLAFPHRRSQSAALRMLSSGVNGQCSPFIARTQLALVMEVIDSGEIWGGKEFIQRLIHQSAQSDADTTQETSDEHLQSLTEREKKVALSVSRGLSNKQIARDMDITERTVKAHLTAIYKKLSIRDRLALALFVKNTSPSAPYVGSVAD